MIYIFKKLYAPLYILLLFFYVVQLRELHLGHLALPAKDMQMFNENFAISMFVTGFGTYTEFAWGIAKGAPWFQHFVFLTFIIGPTICYIFYHDFYAKEGLLYMFLIGVCGSYFFTGDWLNFRAIILTLAIGVTGLFVLGTFILVQIWNSFVKLIQGRQ